MNLLGRAAKRHNWSEARVGMMARLLKAGRTEKVLTTRSRVPSETGLPRYASHLGLPHYTRPHTAPGLTQHQASR